jgi:cytoskeletal protein RodZ
MHDVEQLPLKEWAEQVAQARDSAHLDIGALSRELMLSSAQLRAIEAGTLSAFHGPGYYLRAVEKYARRLGVVLQPPVTELTLSDSQLALLQIKNAPSAANLAAKHAIVLGANAMPRAGRRTQIRIWIAGVLVLLVGIGVWLAVKEGWPSSTISQSPALATNDPVQPDQTSTNPDDTKSIVSPLVQPVEPVITASAVTSPVITAAPAQDVVTVITSDVTPDISNNIASTTAPAALSTLSAETPQIQTTPESTPVAGADNDAGAAPQPQADVIEATFNADCWVEVRFADGKIEQNVYKPGQTFSVPANEIERLTFGNAQAVAATRASAPFDIQRFTRAGNNVARINAQALTP